MPPKLSAPVVGHGELMDPISTLVRKTVGVFFGAELLEWFNMTRFDGWTDMSWSVFTAVVFIVVGFLVRSLIWLSSGSMSAERAAETGADERTARRRVRKPETADLVASKFVYAWSLTHMFEYMFLAYFEQCSPNPKSEESCSQGTFFYFAVMVSVSSALVVQFVANTHEDAHKRLLSKFSILCVKSAPLNVGWAWKRYVDSFNQQLKKEVPNHRMQAVSLVNLFLFIFIFSLFHFYNTATRNNDKKKKELDAWKHAMTGNRIGIKEEKDAKDSPKTDASDASPSDEHSPQGTLDPVQPAEPPASSCSCVMWDASVAMDLLELVDQTALQMMAWSLKGIVGAAYAGAAAWQIVLYMCIVLGTYIVLERISDLVSRFQREALTLFLLFLKAWPLSVGFAVHQALVILRDHALQACGWEVDLSGILLAAGLVHLLVIATIASGVMLASDNMVKARKQRSESRVQL